MPGDELFNRRATLTIGSLRIEALRFAFTVAKKLKKGEANKAEVRVWNLNPSHRSELEEQSEADIPVTLVAGYVNATSVVFSGYVRSAVTTREGPDLVTKVGGGDGEKQMQTARVAKSFGPGTPAAEFFRHVAKAVGVGEGNLNEAVSLLSAQIGNSFVGGTVMYGSAERELTYLCRSFDLDWTIQNGKLQITRRGGVTTDKAILLSPRTGLIGAPTVDSKGVLSCRSLLQPDVFPGRLLVLESERLKGQYRIEETTHQGDTHGSSEAWIVEIKATKF